MQITGGLTITGGAINFNANDPYFNSVSLLTSTTGANTATANTFIDGSANSFAMTRVGNVAQGSFSPYGQSWSNYFDGTGDYLTVGGGMPSGQGTEFTLEFWVYTTSVKEHTFTQGASGGSLDFYVNSSGAVKLDDTGIAAIASSANGAFTFNTWVHIALTRTTGNLYTIYINGVSVGSGTNNTSMTPNTTIGRHRSTASSYLLGYLSNWRVTNTRVYTANFTPPDAPLNSVSGTSLLTCQNNRFIDNSNNNFAITVNGNVRIAKESPYEPTTSYAYGPYGGSVYFDGTGDYLSVPDNTAFDFGSGNFTIEMWVNFTSFTDGKAIITKGWPTLNSPFLIYQDGVNNKVSLYASSNGSSWDIANAIAIINGAPTLRTTWYHIAIVRSGNTFYTFSNGVQTSTFSSASTLFSTNQPVTIGGGSSGSNNFSGYISNVRILKGTALYTANFTPPTEQLTTVANTSLLTCQGSPIVDNSNNRFPITVNGDARVIASSPFTNFDSLYDPGKIGGSAYFNGTTDYLATIGNVVTVGSSNFTFECWAYATTVSQLQFMLSAGSTSQWALGITAANVMSFRPATGTSAEILGTTIITANTWNHYAVVREGGNANQTKIYLNGKLEGIGQASSSFSAVAIQIGTGRGAPTNLFAGYISDARLANAAIYTANFSVPSGPLSLVSTTNANTFALLSSTNAGIFDSAGKNNLITYGDAKVATNVTKFGTGSMSFGGTGYIVVPANINTTFGTGDFTIEFWFYSATSQTANLYDQRTTTNQVTPVIYLNSGVLTYYVSANQQITGSAVPTSQWNHVALARSGTSTKMFLNGTQTGTTYTDSNSYVSAQIGIGAYPVTGVSPFTGYIEDLRVTKGIARYTANFTPPNQPFPRC